MNHLKDIHKKSKGDLIQLAYTISDEGASREKELNTLIKNLEYKISVQNKTNEVLRNDNTELLAQIDGLKTLNTILSKRIQYWKSEVMQNLEGKINISVGADLGLQNDR